MKKKDKKKINWQEWLMTLGFIGIGGCCGLIDKDVLAFTGRLDSLDFEKPIRDFLDKHGVRIVELTQNPMLDIGGILPLKVAAKS